MASFSCKAMAVIRSRPSTSSPRSRPTTRRRRSRAELVLGSGARGPGRARAAAAAGPTLCRAPPTPGALPPALRALAAAADLRPRARREADDMTSAAIVSSEGGHADLDAVMAVMDDSFDPAFRRGLDRAAMRRPAADARRLADARARRRGRARLRSGACRRWRGRVAAARGPRRRSAPGHRPDPARATSSDAAERAAPSRLHLEVREGNHALSLYERAGFGLVGRRRELL